MIWQHILCRIWWLVPNLEFPISNEAHGQIFDGAIAGQYFDFMSQTQRTRLEKCQNTKKKNDFKFEIKILPSTKWFHFSMVVKVIREVCKNSKYLIDYPSWLNV